MKNLSAQDFTPVVEAINSLGIDVYALVSVLTLVGDAKTLTPDVIYSAWQAYQHSPAFKTIGLRAAS